MNVTAFLMLLLAGGALLFFGRALFWVYIALVGFLLGLEATQQHLDSDAQWGPVLAGISLGLVAFLVSIIFQNLAVYVAGLVGGAYLVLWAAGIVLSINAGASMFGLAFLGGVLAALFFSVFFDPALVVASATTGAGLLIQPFGLSQGTSVSAWLALTVIGVVFQLAILSRAERPRVH